MEGVGIWPAKISCLHLILGIRNKSTSKWCLPPNECWAYWWQGLTNTKQTGPVTKSVCKLKLQLSSWLTGRGLQSEPLHWISLDMNHLSMQYFLAQNIVFSQQHLGVLSQGLPPFDKAWFVLKKTKSSQNRESFWHLNGFLAIFSSSFQSLFPANFSSRTKVSTDRNRKWPFMSSPKKSAVNSPEVESNHSRDES